MPGYDTSLNWIDGQREKMCALVKDWADQNSGSRNLVGLARMAEKLKAAFSGLGEFSEIDLPPEECVDSDGRMTHVALGKALLMRKRPEAAVRVFVGIHMDTVFGVDHPFQSTSLDKDRMLGPGVTDAKGGLAVMLVALEALEKNSLAKNIGWEVLINPDEELGSPGSAELFKASARRNHLGLLFEPALPSWAMVSERKGSGNFVAIVRGRSAHAGREIHLGRNAIHALAELIVTLKQISEQLPGVTVNVGKIEGGGPVNVVPDLAIARFNVRVATQADQTTVESELKRLIDDMNRREGINVALHGGFTAPPKRVDKKLRRLIDEATQCGRELGIDLNWKPSGGVCDGNRLAAAGLPNIDTLGVRGGGIHTAGEYLLLDSLTERAKLAALLLMKLAAGEIPASLEEK